MPPTFPGAPDDLTRADLTHGDVADALAAVQAATLPSADTVVTGARDFRGTAAYVGDYIDIIGYSPQTGEPTPNSGIRYSVNESAAGGTFVVAHDCSDIVSRGVSSDTLTVGESTPVGSNATSFTVILPTVGASGSVSDYIPVTAAEVVAVFNSSAASDRVTATLLPGHDGTGIVYAGGGSELAGGTITPHVKIAGGIVTSPVTIHPTEGNETPLTLRPALGSTIGTAVLNIEHYDGSPNGISNYGVAHIDSDGGGGFSDDRITWSQHGQFHVDGDPADIGGDAPFKVGQAFSVGASYAAMLISGRTADQVGWMFYPHNEATADVMVSYDPVDGSTPRFRVTPMGEVHARGGLVLTSPDGTAYRLVVADDGTLSTEPA